MHHCLLVPELAARIADACAPLDYRETCFQSDYKPRFSTLCALARTCRILQEPALDVIWYYQFGLQNLVRCMPMWMEIYREDPDEKYVVDHGWCGTRAMYVEIAMQFDDTTAEDLERFDFYARRVRKLECRQYYVGRGLNPKSQCYAEVDSAVIRRLQEVKGAPLLPNIQSVLWTVRDIPGASFDGFRCLLTPSIISLDLICERDEGEVLPNDLIAAISTECPQLQRLRLQAPFNSLNNELMFSALRNFGTLQQLALVIDDNNQRLRNQGPYAVTSSLLSQLAAMPNLSELRLSRKSFYVRDEHVVGPFNFPFLKVLHLYMDAITSSVNLWRDCMFPSLKELSVEYGTSNSYSTDLELLSQIVSNVSHDTLQSLTLGCSRPAWISVSLASEEGMVSPIPLRSLLVFRNLRHLTFELPLRPYVPLTDGDLETFARAWPNLRTLRVANDVKTITYRGLAVLIHLCPDLSELIINIAPTPVLEPGDVADLPAGHSVLLDFGTSAVGDVESAVLWLEKVLSQDSSIPQHEILWDSTRRQPAWREMFALLERKRTGILVDAVRPDKERTGHPVCSRNSSRSPSPTIIIRDYRPPSPTIVIRDT